MMKRMENPVICESQVCKVLLNFLVLNAKHQCAGFFCCYVLIRMKFTLNEEKFDV